MAVMNLKQWQPLIEAEQNQGEYEMKRILIMMLASLVCCCGLFASFDGFTTFGPSYSFHDGNNYMGLDSDSFGFVNDCPVGYYAGLNAEFNLKDVDNWKIGMIVGPSYSYSFGDSDVSLDVALGLSMEGTSLGFFSFGVGGYIGADWRMNSIFGLGIGTQIGSNFVDVNLDNGKFGVSGDFYVSPTLSAIFYY